MARYSLAVLSIIAVFSAGWWARGVFVLPVESVALSAESPDPPVQLKMPETHLLTTVKISGDPKGSTGLLDQFMDFLVADQYGKALQIYVDQTWQADQAMRQAYYAAVLSFLDELFKDHLFHKVIQFTTVFLDQYPNDYGVAVFRAKSLVESTQIEEAIKTLYGVIHYAPGEKEEKRTFDYIHQLALKHYQQLSAQNKWMELEVFYRYLLTEENVYYPYYLYFASILIKTNDYSGAESYLLPLLDDPELKDAAAHMLKRVHLLEVGGSVITLTKAGNHYLSHLSLDDYSATLLLDTGASFSTISPELFSQLPTNQRTMVKQEMSIDTANGAVHAPVYKISKINFGKYELRDVEFAVLSLEMEGVDGLLGMNILENFHFELDQINSELTLQPH